MPASWEGCCFSQGDGCPVCPMFCVFQTSHCAGSQGACVSGEGCSTGSGPRGPVGRSPAWCCFDVDATETRLLLTPAGRPAAARACAGRLARVPAQIQHTVCHGSEPPGHSDLAQAQPPTRREAQVQAPQKHTRTRSPARRQHPGERAGMARVTGKRTGPLEVMRPQGCSGQSGSCLRGPSATPVCPERALFLPLLAGAGLQGACPLVSV